MNQNYPLLVCVWLTLHISAFCLAEQTFELEFRSIKQSAEEESMSLRGIAVDEDDVIWVGGSNASLFKSENGGQTWRKQTLDVPQTSDFRDIETTRAGLLAMSAGVGPNSRVMLTQDSGKKWKCVLENPDAEGFFNGMAFREDGFGALVGDPIEGRLTVFVTSDGGLHWKRITGPKVTLEEYGFAASGTGIVVDASQGIGIVTGGSQAQFYYRSSESNAWSSRALGMRHGTKSAGAFSCDFLQGVGIAIGGDYLKPELTKKNVAVTRDHGKTWTVPKVTMPHKSCVMSLGGERFLACGRTGLAMTADGGMSWKELTTESFYTMALPTRVDRSQNATAVWLAGANGRVALLTIPKE